MHSTQRPLGNRNLDSLLDRGSVAGLLPCRASVRALGALAPQRVSEYFEGLGELSPVVSIPLGPRGCCVAGVCHTTLARRSSSALTRSMALVDEIVVVVTEGESFRTKEAKPRGGGRAPKT